MMIKKIPDDKVLVFLSESVQYINYQPLILNIITKTGSSNQVRAN